MDNWQLIIEVCPSGKDSWILLLKIHGEADTIIINYELSIMNYQLPTDTITDFPASLFLNKAKAPWKAGGGLCVLLGELQKNCARSIIRMWCFTVPYCARWTLPERKHLVQAVTLQGVPFTIALTFWTLGLKLLFVRLCEWETLIPKVTPLPQISHFAMGQHLLKQHKIWEILIKSDTGVLRDLISISLEYLNSLSKKAFNVKRFFEIF